MLVRKSDIGGEIISILTRGMYLDPKDALREYIQNGVDASATEISVKIRQDIIVIQDNGLGMDKDTIRNAVRVGISEKNPNKNVGFMGIGIYSSFHLCDDLHIYSRTNQDPPNHLHFNFKGMRDRLTEQRELKFSSSIADNEIIALQDLLESNITLTDIDSSEFPKKGTRVEMTGIEPSFFKTLSKFNEVANYLEQVVALPFNPDFKYGKDIQAYIHGICQQYNLNFSLIDLKLQINDERKVLYRPYLDSHFEPQSQEPKFHILKFNNDFFGIAWGCLNQSTKTIKNNSIRGFIIKKQGFTIGNRDDLLTYFGRQTFYNRYVGEVIVLHPHLLPNASRSEFEYSPIRIEFQECLKEMAVFFNKEANLYQETVKAEEDLNNAIKFLKEEKAKLEFLHNNSDELLTNLWKSKEFIDSLKRRKKNKYYTDNKHKAETVIKQIEEFSSEIRSIIDTKKSTRNKPSKSENQVATEIEEIPEVSAVPPDEVFDSLAGVFESIGFDTNRELSVIIELIDENYIRLISTDAEDYKKRLSKLKNDFEELLD